jgi:hypothetical protein
MGQQFTCLTKYIQAEPRSEFAARSLLLPVLLLGWVGTSSAASAPKHVSAYLSLPLQMPYWESPALP